MLNGRLDGAAYFSLVLITLTQHPSACLLARHVAVLETWKRGVPPPKIRRTKKALVNTTAEGGAEPRASSEQANSFSLQYLGCSHGKQPSEAQIGVIRL